VYKEINLLINESDKGLIIKNGINVAIVGKTNVGKSSILNSLLNKNKAIVTNIEGTTRDTVEDSILIDGIMINFIDTAGIRKTKDKVEKLGIKKSINAIDEADLILFVVDSSSKFDNEDRKILNKIKNKKILIVYNKIDKKDIEFEELNKYDYIKVSAINKKNIDKLKERISNIFKFDRINESDFTYISNARQIALLKKCKEIGNNIENAISNNMPIDMIEIDIKELWDTLGEITGESYSDELLDEIFSKFCLGK
jgi:tRNA modification GTPase